MKRYIYIMLSALWLAIMGGCAKNEPEVLGSLEGYSVELASVTSTTATVRITLPVSAVEIVRYISIKYNDWQDIELKEDRYNNSGSVKPDGNYDGYGFKYRISTENSKKIIEITMLNLIPDSKVELQVVLNVWGWYSSFNSYDYYNGSEWVYPFENNYARTVTFRTLSIQEDPDFRATTDGQPAYLKADVMYVTDNEAVLELSTNYKCGSYDNSLVISENEDFTDPIYDRRIQFGEKIDLYGLSANTTYYMKVIIGRLVYDSEHYDYLKDVSLIPTPGSFTTAAE